jgi:succinate semialdehyde reductase (NADPH)
MKTGVLWRTPPCEAARAARKLGGHGRPPRSTVRAAVVRRHGGPFAVEELRDPQPRAGEVLVRVAACGVCHTDLHIHDGSVPFPAPMVLGHEIAGTVVEVGAGVEDVAVGERVVGAFIMPCGTCSMCRGGREELCEPFFAHNRLNGTLYDGETRLYDEAGAPVWQYSMGGLAELAVMPVRGVAPIPEGLPTAESAIFGCALMTAYGAVVHVGDLQPGEDVAVLGAGGVGGSIVQLARALGAGRVIAVDVDDAKLALARALGADDLVNAAGTDAVAAIREITDGRGADVVFEAIGHPGTVRQATEAVADGGRVVLVGIAPAGATAEVEVTRIVRRKLQVLGSFGGRPRRDLPALMRLALDGKLRLEGAIGRRFTLDQADAAYRHLEAGTITGRAIVEL